MSMKKGKFQRFSLCFCYFRPFMSVINVRLDKGRNSFYDKSVQETMKFRQFSLPLETNSLQTDHSTELKCCSVVCCHLSDTLIFSCGGSIQMGFAVSHCQRSGAGRCGPGLRAVIPNMCSHSRVAAFFQEQMEVTLARAATFGTPSVSTGPHQLLQ